jgi:hypothetical protein
MFFQIFTFYRKRTCTLQGPFRLCCLGHYLASRAVLRGKLCTGVRKTKVWLRFIHDFHCKCTKPAWFFFISAVITRIYPATGQHKTKELSYIYNKSPTDVLENTYKVQYILRNPPTCFGTAVPSSGSSKFLAKINYYIKMWRVNVN